MDVETFSALRVGLATSDDIRSWSNGEVKKPETINYRTLKPEKDGLFCEKIFGPTKDWECSCGKYKRVRFKGIVCERCGVEVTKSSVRRERMGHIELAAPVTHIWYFKGVPSRLGYLLNMAPKDLEKIIYFAAYRVMSIDLEAKKFDGAMVKDDYVHRIEALVNDREAELIAAAPAEYELLSSHGLKLQLSNRFWEAPVWVDAQAHKALEQLLKAEEKNPDGFWGKKGADAADEPAEAAASITPELALTDKSVKQAIAEFKKKGDKIVREYARIERPANLQKEQLAWHLYLTAKTGDLIQNDVIFDHFDYYYGEYVVTEIGAEAVQQVLAEFDLESEATELREQIATTKGSKQTQAIKRLKVVNSFMQSSTPPTSMVLDVLPVLPPEIRPMVQLDGGRFATSDLNDLYRRVINRNNRLKRFIDLGAVPKTILNNEKRMLQEAVDALFDNGRRGRPVTGTGNRALKSLSDLLKGKQGRFRQNLLGKRVDYSGRSVIVVGPQLKLHQCGLPKLMALELFKPFVMKRLVDQGLAQNIKSAKRMVERSRPQVWGVLEEVIRERPVLLNRAPTLHRLGIQAFEPLLVEGKAIQLHPLVCAAFNADFDGDQMAVHLPLSVEAQAEARLLMLASNNILKPSDGKPVATPTQDMIIGLYFMTTVKEGAIGEGRAIGSLAEAQLAFDAGNLDIGAKIKLRTRGELRHTTFGRALFNETLPEDFEYIEDTVAGKPIKAIGKKEIGKIVTMLVEAKSRVEVAQALDRIKDAGFYWATRSGVTMSISDANFDSKGEFDKARSKMIIDAEKEHTKIQEAFDNGLKSDLERRDELGALWFKRTNEIQQLLQESMPEDNAINTMVTSGARGNWLQIRSIVGMRGPVATSSGDFAPMPVKGNYLIGLTANEYFINATGARKGNADTAMKTAAAGYLTRRLVDVAQDVIIREADCGTTRGLEKNLLDPNEVELSILHRTLAEDIKSGTETIKAGTRLNQRLADQMAAAGVETISVRSVLTCESLNGVCAACYGTSLATGDPVELGEAIGIIAAQSIGEPGTQLTMRTFHTGGAAENTEKRTILKSIGGQKVRVERLISYDITQGLNGVTDLLEARVGWRQAGKVAVMSFWDGVVRIEKIGATVAQSQGLIRDAVFYDLAPFAKSKRAALKQLSLYYGNDPSQASKISGQYGSAVVAPKNAFVVEIENGDDGSRLVLITRPSLHELFYGKSPKDFRDGPAELNSSRRDALAKALSPRQLESLERAAKARIPDSEEKKSNGHAFALEQSIVDNISAVIQVSKDIHGSSLKGTSSPDAIKMEVLNLKFKPSQKVYASEGEFVKEGSLLVDGLDELKFEYGSAFIEKDDYDKFGKTGFLANDLIAVRGGVQFFNVYVHPASEGDFIQAEKLSANYSFSRTTSKTFKKLHPLLPVNDRPISSLDDLVVENGETVKSGDYIVDGTPIPHEVLHVKGPKEAAAEIIRGVQAIYGSQGVPLHDKHLEVIVRQMLGKVTVIESGDTDMLPGEVIDRTKFAAKNREAQKNKLKPASARQEVMGMTRASLASQSWLSSASFQETTRVLTQAALDRSEDKLVGLKENVIIGKLIPAGTGLAEYRNVDVNATEEAKAARYPNRIWSAQETAAVVPDDFATADLAFTSFEDWDSEKSE